MPPKDWTKKENEYGAYPPKGQYVKTEAPKPAEKVEPKNTGYGYTDPNSVKGTHEVKMVKPVVVEVPDEDGEIIAAFKKKIGAALNESQPDVALQWASGLKAYLEAVK